MYCPSRLLAGRGVHAAPRPHAWVRVVRLLATSHGAVRTPRLTFKRMDDVGHRPSPAKGKSRAVGFRPGLLSHQTVRLAIQLGAGTCDPEIPGRSGPLPHAQ